MNIKKIAIVGATAGSLALASLLGAAGANAEDGTAGSPIVRKADRGTVMTGVGEARLATQGLLSFGAPKVVKDGNFTELPSLGGNQAICDGDAAVTLRQGFAVNGMINC